jgi:hypothetical protein
MWKTDNSILLEMNRRAVGIMREQGVNVIDVWQLSKDKFTRHHLNNEGIHISAQQDIYYKALAAAIMYDVVRAAAAQASVAQIHSQTPATEGKNDSTAPHTTSKVSAHNEDQNKSATANTSSRIQEEKRRSELKAQQPSHQGTSRRKALQREVASIKQTVSELKRLLGGQLRIQMAAIRNQTVEIRKISKWIVKVERQRTEADTKNGTGK